jgi:hypothetical protein
MLSNLLTDVSNSMGSFIEQFVPETLRRNSEQDAMQRASDETERRIGESVLFASHDGEGRAPGGPRVVAPTMHMALNAVRHYRTRKQALDNPVVYASQADASVRHAIRLDRHVYLVNRTLDELYRTGLDELDVLVEEECRRLDNTNNNNNNNNNNHHHHGPRRSDAEGAVWARIQYELGASPHELFDPSRHDAELREIRNAKRAEGAVAHALQPRALDPNEWVIYTRRSSAFMATLSTLFGGDGLFSLEKYTLQFVGGTEVRFPTVAFFLGALDEFVRENTYTAASSDPTVLTIDIGLLDELAHDAAPAPARDAQSQDTNPDELESGQRYAGIHRSFRLPEGYVATPPATTVYPCSRVLSESLQLQTDWVMLPAWTWSVYTSGRTVAGNTLKSVDGICTALSLIETAVLEQVAGGDAAAAARIKRIGASLDTLKRVFAAAATTKAFDTPL